MGTLDSCFSGHTEGEVDLPPSLQASVEEAYAYINHDRTAYINVLTHSNPHA